MTGKVPGLSPAVGAVRIRGRLQVVWNEKFQRYVAKSWPKGNGGDTPRRKVAREEFIKAAALIKHATPEEVQAATDLTRNTPFLIRDVLMMAAYGRLIEGTTKDGVTWKGIRTVAKDMSDLLDMITNVPGSVLYRGDTDWLGLGPGAANQLLVVDPTTMKPKWADYPQKDALLQAMLDDLSTDEGSIVVRTAGGWVHLAPGGAGTYLTAHGTGADLTWGAVSATNALAQALLDLLGSTRGDVIYRGASGWAVLGTGTSGQYLKTQGAGADPAWADSLVSSAYVNSLLNAISSTRGAVLYRGASGWSVLAPGTSGYVLTTQGSGADPAWLAGGGGGGGAGGILKRQAVNFTSSTNITLNNDTTYCQFKATGFFNCNIVMPATPSDGQLVVVYQKTAVNSVNYLHVSPNTGQTMIPSNPHAIVSGSSGAWCAFNYDLANTTWEAMTPLN